MHAAQPARRSFRMPEQPLATWHIWSALPICSRCSQSVQTRRQRRHAQAHRQVVTAATAMDQLPELKQKLRDIIESVGTSTAFPPGALPVLEQIDDIVQEAGVPKVWICYFDTLDCTVRALEPDCFAMRKAVEFHLHCCNRSRQRASAAASARRSTTPTSWTPTATSRSAF